MRIKKRAQEKIAEALEEERLERLGPGGLDPAEVETYKGTVRLNLKGVFAINESGYRLTSN